MLTSELMPVETKMLSVALAGNPNAGKSTLFNALTGARQHVGNWPGKTVEKKTGEFFRGDRRVQITDLPGAYSLSAYTLEEVITRDYLLEDRPDVVIAVADATNLERNLYLVVQLLELALPAVVVLNMMDVAARQGLRIDTEGLARALGVPVVAAVARREEGIDAVISAACDAAAAPPVSCRLDYGPDIEKTLAEMQPVISGTAAAAGYPPRWLALRLLEGDNELSERLDALPGGRDIAAMARGYRASLEARLGEDIELEITDRRYTWIHELVRQVVTVGSERTVSRSDRIDRVLTDRRLGIPAFLLAMWLVFKITTDLSAPWVDWIDGVLSGPVSRWAGAVISAAGLAGSWVESLVIDGVIAGVGGVLAFVPVLIFLYLALAILEDSGYMARGAFVMDRMMNRIGLHGRSFLPLMVGFGCSVPAIYSTRTLTSKRDRILTGLLVPFMSCGARLPVYVLFAAIFFPSLSSVVILGLYLLGIVIAIGVGLLLQRTLLPAEGASGLVMELPPYRLPNIRSVRVQVSIRTRAFLRHAASLILFTSMVIWLLMSIPVSGSGSFADVAIEDSAFGRVADAMTPALEPLGFGSWQSSGALLSGLVAKEVVVSTLAQTYGVDSPSAVADGGSLRTDLVEIVSSFFQALADMVRAIPGLIGINLTDETESAEPGLATALHVGFTETSGGHAAAAGLAFMVFVLLYTPCMAAIAAERHELGARWAWLSLGGQLVIAWIAAFLVFRLGVWLGGG